MQSSCGGFRGYRAWEAENPGGIMDAFPIALPNQFRQAMREPYARPPIQRHYEITPLPLPG